MFHVKHFNGVFDYGRNGNNKLSGSDNRKSVIGLSERGRDYA